MRKRPSEQPTQLKHQYNGWVVKVHCRQAENDNVSYKDVEVDMVAFGANHESFVCQSLLAQKCPFDISVMHKCKAALLKIGKEKRIAKILASRPDELNEGDIVHLYSRIENFYKNSQHKDSRNSFSAATRFIRDSKLKKSDGKIIGSVPYKCDLPILKRKIIPLMSSAGEGGIDDKEIAAPATIPTAEKADEAEALVLNHIDGRLWDLTKRIKLYIHKALLLRKNIVKKKSLGVPSGLSEADAKNLQIIPFARYRQFTKYNAETRFHSLCWVIENERRFEKSVATGANLNDYDPLNEVNLTGSYGVAQWLLCDHYLTREILTCLGLLLSVSFGCNPSVIFGIKNKQIRKLKNGFELLALKTKTDQLDNYSIVTPPDYSKLSEEQKLDKFPARFAVELIVNNYESIKEKLKYEGSKIFIAPNAHTGGKFEILGIQVSDTLKRLCIKFGIENFTLSTLRPQIASAAYLKSKKNIYFVQAILKHSSLSATHKYLDNSLFHLLNERNINRFILMLEQSVYFVAGRPDEVDRSLGEEFLNSAENLLFPVSDFTNETEKCLASAWLKSMGTLKIYIDDAMVYLCSSTLKYYLGNAERIAASDPEKFLQSHVPLILICAALHKLISTSPLAGRLNYYDQQGV